jgi:hypothetical protein
LTRLYLGAGYMTECQRLYSTYLMVELQKLMNSSSHEAPNKISKLKSLAFRNFDITAMWRPLSMVVDVVDSSRLSLYDCSGVIAFFAGLARS